MTVEEARERYELYWMGVLEEPERAEVRERMREDGEGAAVAARLVWMLGGGLVELVEPPKRLRARLLESVAPKRTGSWWKFAEVAGVLGLLLIAFFSVRDARKEVARLRVEGACFEEVLALMNAPETMVRVSGEGAAQPPRGKVFVNPTRGVLLLASNLPPAPEGRIYEMWLLPRAGNPIAAGLFQSEAGGTALHFLKQSLDPERIDAIAVTVEPAGGSPQPTTAPFLVTRLRS